MDPVTTSEWLWAALIALAAVTLWPKSGLVARWREYREDSRRALLEDALKHVLSWDTQGRDATLESLAGALGLSPKRALRLVTELESRRMLRSAAGGLQLTAEGERLALHVVRAHRLWERYLADDAGVPMARLHGAAERAEHRLTPETLDELDAHLGHPERDPHGDPIPTAGGDLAPVDAVELTDWPVDEPARIVHLEDEPPIVFQQILAAGLRPGQTVRILEKTADRLVLSDGHDEHRLASAVAANIQVAPERSDPDRLAGAKRLTDLGPRETAVVAELDPACQGFTRRRLMDLGLTPGTPVRVALENTFGDPRAFLVRGTTIALRKPQTDQIWVRAVADDKTKTEAA